MTLNYYKNEWTPKEWRAIIDKAEELGCGGRYRAEWAEHIHKYIQEAARL